MGLKSKRLITFPSKTRVVTFQRVIAEIGLIIFSSLLFALSFPSPVSNQGISFLAFFILIPVFLVIRNIGWFKLTTYAVLFGYTSYALYNYWLANFHPLAIIIVPVVYVGYFILLFPCLKLADVFFPRYGYILQVIIWVSYEYVKSLGFLGYSYGILGYTQYLWHDFIGLARITGIWGISLLVVGASGFLAKFILEKFKYHQTIRDFIVHQRIPLVIYSFLLISNIIYGSVSKTDYSGYPKWKVALIQQNIDPWRGGFDAYEKSLKSLLRLSDSALNYNPDIVIWSETAFVPGIDWHTKYRTDSRRFQLVKSLREYLNQQTVPFIVGNDDGQLERTEEGERRVDYNAALLFENGEIINTYRKIHLVPFTESFPFKKKFPSIYEWLLEADTHFWEKGNEFVVFETDTVRFAVLICFEDTFGYLGREFVLKGAEVLVNITNDSWSFSVPAEVQHMMLAVFRAVENRRSLVRSTNGGITVAIDPDGRILDSIEPFTNDFLISTIPIVTKSTFYTLYGDWLGKLLLIISLLSLTIGVIKKIYFIRK